MSAQYENWLRSNGFGAINRLEPVGGGCINNTTRIYLEQGSTVFLKQQDSPPADFFEAEKTGLTALNQAQALRVPKVIHCETDFLLLEDLGQGTPSNNYWETLGTGLAELHKKTQASFGFIANNYCGSTPQINTPTHDGHEFFARYRILALMKTAFNQGQLDTSDIKSIEILASKLSQWIPEQASVLIHGDLWSGNIHCDQYGNPALIDPAAYWGWAEADLAMTLLFGGFNKVFYSSYEHASSLENDWRDRAPLYNLYHLLNHLVLFGGSYLAQVQSIVKRYVGK
jgi:protein-ribulosamine 3-kinase